MLFLQPSLSWKWLEFSALFLLLEIFHPGGSQAHRGTLILYPGLGQAQILHVDSTCKPVAEDTRTSPNSLETHPVRKRGHIGHLRALSPWINVWMDICKGEYLCVYV